MAAFEKLEHSVAGVREHLLAGQVIPAHPLALDQHRKLDERSQRALTRYYMAAGAGGVAVGVHTTQFAIRRPEHGLYEPVLALAAEAINDELGRKPRGFARIAGIVGHTRQALGEVELALKYGYDAGLLSLAGWDGASDDLLIRHCEEIAAAIPLFGFYLQPAVGGLPLGYEFWRRFVEIERVVAIKIAPFDRYRTLEVMRAVADSGRLDIALYTGNDDSIVSDLITPYPAEGRAPLVMAGGLLGHWAVWTRRAVELLDEIKVKRAAEGGFSSEWMVRAAQVTEMNAALFDARHNFAGCIAGINEVLHRQGLLAGNWCLDPNEGLSPGQMAELDRVTRLYPGLLDDEFVAAGLDDWRS
jgi:dihydrodipicolinate synthase/N-acetylneuraminate lyase